jgi:hypothetical protein
MQAAAADGVSAISDVLAALSNGPTGAPASAEARIKLLERRMTGGDAGQRSLLLRCRRAPCAMQDSISMMLTDWLRARCRR